MKDLTGWKRSRLLHMNGFRFLPFLKFTVAYLFLLDKKRIDTSASASCTDDLKRRES